MTFWAYILHCKGGYFYTGHTDNLERRMGQHHAKAFPGFTSDHHPVHLVWSQDFPSRNEALYAERQIKGWSRAKKMALIRGDWEYVSVLARNRSNRSTSVRPELVEGLSFVGLGAKRRKNKG